MKNQTRNEATLSSRDLLSLVEAKRAEILAKRIDLKALIAEVKRVKQEETTAEMAEASNKFSGLWAEAVKLGMTEREVVSLQNLDTKLRVLGEMFGVCASRAREIRSKAERKMRHPTRHDLARRLGLSVRLLIDQDPHHETMHPLRISKTEKSRAITLQLLSERIRREILQADEGEANCLFHRLSKS